MTQNNLFDRIRLQSTLRTILNTWGEEQGYAIIQSALEKEIRYDEYKRRERARVRVMSNSVCRTST